MAGDVLTGCRATFQLNGVVQGYATGVSVRENIQYDPVVVLDNIHVKEHAPVGYECSMTAEFVRIVGDDLKSRGLLPKQGSSAADHLTNIIASGELTATLVDSQTGQIVANVEGVRISESSVNITARGIVGENVSMVAILMRNEGDL